MSDGGHVCLDWYNIKSKDQPTVLFLPGITGTVWCTWSCGIPCLNLNSNLNFWPSSQVYMLLAKVNEPVCVTAAGSSDENYIRHFIQDMTGLGYR